MKKQPSILKYKQLGIPIQKANVVFLKDDSYISISEGFEALTRIGVSTKTNSIVASLNVLTSKILLKDEIGLSDTAAKKSHSLKGLTSKSVQKKSCFILR